MSRWHSRSVAIGSQAVQARAEHFGQLPMRLCAVQPGELGRLDTLGRIERITFWAKRETARP